MRQLTANNVRLNYTDPLVIEESIDGFTLVEVLATLTVFSILVGTAYGALSVLSTVNQTAQNNSSSAREERLFYTDFTRNLRACIRPGVDPSVVFNGEQTSLHFSYRSAHSKYGREDIFYRFDSVKDRLISEHSGIGDSRRLELSQVKSLTLYYWDLTSHEWCMHWNQKNSVPAAVKLEIQRSAQSSKRTMTVYIPAGEIDEASRR